MSLKEVHEPFSSNSRGPIHEEQRLQIEELDEWRTHKREHTTNQNYARTSSIPFQINLRLEIKFYWMPQILTLSLPNLMKKFLLRYLAFFHSVQSRFTTLTRLSTRACLEPCGNRTKILPSKGYDKSPRPWDRAVGEIAKTTRAWTFIHGCGRREQSRTAVCTNTPKNIGLSPGRVSQNLLIPFTIHHLLHPKSLTLVAASPHGLPATPVSHLQSTEEEALEDIIDDVPPCHEDPPPQPPPPSRPVNAAASYNDISSRLTQFKQQCFQHFDNIDATLQQICHHFHISSPPPPCEPSRDEDV
ncbi:hypothetical protein GOBAR_AA04810 [Gossypium barbadense]|uniref:Uncharacterized protein n=1 Tax=Gossypium barbadense TaxID=3634 RepID=A0A2P5YJJ1_GOSBA|nr:hypothetical protein GOBAR_AA04810 [Gossypium barbadense]